jgi:UMF1 family MFS transporter
LICLAFVFYGFEDSTLAPRISFFLVGIWWLGFAQIAFRVLPSGKSRIPDKQASIFSNGFKELKIVWTQLKHIFILRRFLSGFFFYSMGVQTVMLAAAEFGSKEIKKEKDGVMVPMEAQDLIITILLIQLVAIAGAMMMSRLSRKIGNINVLIISVLIWIGICVAAYFTYNETQFYLLAVAVGLVMGGIQSMSRSTYSKLLPKTADTTWFY